MANCNYKVNIKDIQSKYSFKIFCAGDNAEVQAEIGNLEDLTTTAKNNLVSAINEVDGELSAKEDKSNKVTTITSSSTDTQYPSAKLLYNQLALKEDVANKTTTLSSSSTDTQYPSAKAVYDSQETQNETISTLESNLEETQEELDYYKTIYNVLPKVNNNGESITLDNTGESILKLDPRGQCKQDSTTGIQLFNKAVAKPVNCTLTYTNGIYRAVATGSSPHIDFAMSLPAGNYTMKTNSAFGTPIFSYNGTSVSNLGQRPSAFTASFTLSSEIDLLRLWFADTVDFDFDTAMIVSGTYTSETMPTYEPYTGGQPSPSPDFPQQIHEVSGDNEVVVCGKNIFNSTIDNGGIDTTTGNEIVNYGYARCGYIQVIGGKEISVQYKNDLVSGQIVIYEYDENKTYLGFHYNTGKTYTRTLENNTKYIRLRLAGQAQLPLDEISNVMVEYSSTPSTYEPYNGDTYEIDLGVENLVNAMQESFTLPASETTYQKIISNTSADNKVHLVANTKYYISYTIKNASTSNTRSTPRLYLDSSNYYQKTETNRNITAGRKVEEYTPTTTGDYSVEYWLQGSNVDVVVSDYMISTENASFTPYGQTPIKMRGIGTYEDYFTKNTGKNLVNKLTKNGNTIYIGDITTPTFIFEAGTYTISYESSKTIGVYMQKESDVSSTNLGNDKVITFTSNEKFSIWFWQSGLQIEDIIHPMFNKGSTPLPYEPYGTGQWCKYNAMGEIVLGNTFTWIPESLSETVYRFSTNISYLNSIPYVYGVEDGCCNYFKYLMQYSGSLGVERIYTNGNNIICITSVASTSSGLNTWLSSHNTIIDYPLAKPYLSLIEDTTLISQLDKVEKALAKLGQTNISQVNNDAPFKIYASALKEIE